MSSTSPAAAAEAIPLKRDAGVIGLVGLAHLISHYSQLLLAPLFPWLKDAFGVGYLQLGFLMTLFFAVSCAVQAASGFWVDRFGARPVLFGGLGLLALAAFGFAASPSYGAMAVCACVAGAGNGVFHPADYTLMNRLVSSRRIGHAYSFHGVTGSLGWALAPAMLVPLAIAFSWRHALAAAGVLILVVLATLWSQRDRLALPPAPSERRPQAGEGGGFAFLKSPAVWNCFVFFLLYATVLSVVQAFAPEAARHLHAVPVGLMALCVTTYMVASAAGMLAGGFLAHGDARSEIVVTAAFGVAAAVALAMALAPVPGSAVPALFAAMGLATGLAGPSRDLIVKRATPPGASGRVYGIVYSGLDIGQALAPLGFGLLMDSGRFQAVWLGLAAFQIAIVAGAFQVVRTQAREGGLSPETAAGGAR